MFSYWDMVADLVGILIYAALRPLFMRSYLWLGQRFGQGDVT
jgi:hypothetical protein